MKFQKQYLWLAVTADEYELPLAVEDTAAAYLIRTTDICIMKMTGRKVPQI